MSGAEGPLRIAVAGGSIGGLCAGLTLRGAGIDVQVYERVSGPMETRGAGIVVQGELIDLLRAHGAEALPTTRCAVRRYLSPEGGEGKVQRAPQDFTSWEAIYRTLADAFPSNRYHRGATLTDFGNGEGPVQAHIDGHGVVEAYVLVAADGAQSPPSRFCRQSSTSRRRARSSAACAFSATRRSSFGRTPRAPPPRRLETRRPWRERSSVPAGTSTPA